MTEKQKVIQAQLTLRAVVWDLPDHLDIDTGRLQQEMECFQIRMISVAQAEHDRKPKDDCRKKYQKILESLAAAGILEHETLLVTQDAAMAAYVSGDGQERIESGMAVVFYENTKEQMGVPADLVVLGFEEIGVQFLDRVQKRKNHLPWNILYTERTCVREITAEDLDELYVIYEGEGITDFTEPLFERKKEEEYTRSYIQYMYYYYGYGMWVIQDRQSGKLLGRAGIEHRPTQQGTVMELGYIIRAEEQGKGYATEVCQAILAYAKQELEIKELHCFIHPKNQASIHLAAKLGFVRCGHTGAAQDGLLDFIKCIHIS
ncbi:MAG: GNAT family N-acetyltransferase [Eubacterium sp.]|nr:GNAT family N-acetyltransferase [Eubacterium sp.]